MTTRIQQSLVTAIVIATLSLTACSDPYERTLPPSGLLTVGQAESLGRDLSDSDRALLTRWASRSITSQRFPGETTPSTVKLAIINQQRYESMKAQEKAKEDARAAAEAIAAKREREQRALAVNQLKEADAIIKQYFTASPISYDIAPMFNSYGEVAYREWRFNLRLQNNTPKEIIGVSGKVQVSDAFGKEIGIFDVRFEPLVPPNKSINFTATMRYNPNSPGQTAMLNTQTLFFDWLFDSLAFRDGTIIDRESIAQAKAEGNATESNLPL